MLQIWMNIGQLQFVCYAIVHINFWVISEQVQQRTTNVQESQRSTIVEPSANQENFASQRSSSRILDMESRFGINFKRRAA